MDMMQDGLFWAMSTNDAQISGMATMGNGRDRNEKHSIGPRDGGHALCQAVYLSGIGLLSQSTIRNFAEFGIFSQLTGVGVEGIAVASSVDGAGHWGCTGGCIEKMEMMRMVMLAFDPGCWGQVMVGGGCMAS